MATNWNATDYEADLLATDALTRTFWVALMSVKTSKTAAGTEFSDVDYGRVAVTMTKDGAVAGKIYNHGGAVVFGTPAADWPDAAGITLYDAETSGNARYFMDLVPPVACSAGAPVSIPVDALTETFG